MASLGTGNAEGRDILMKRTTDISASAQRPVRKLGRPSRNYSARKQILRGAQMAFGQKPYADTSVEDICKASDVSRRTFYRFFRNKDDVFEAIFDLASTFLVQTVRSAVDAAQTPMDKLEAAVEAYLRAQEAAGPLARVLTLEPRNPGSRLAVRYDEVVASFAEIFRAEVERSRQLRIDPLLFGGLLAAMENVSLELLRHGPISEAELKRGKLVMLRILSAALAEQGDHVHPLPLAR